MDRNPPTNQEVQRLIQLGASARWCLTGEVVALRRRLDIPARIRGSLKNHPGIWLAASLASGIATSILLRRNPRATNKRRSLPGTLLGLTLTAARPMVKIWLGNQVNLWLARMVSPTPENRLISRPSPISKFR